MRTELLEKPLAWFWGQNRLLRLGFLQNEHFLIHRLAFPYRRVKHYIYTRENSSMLWLVIVFVAAISYWVWVQKDEQRRVDGQVERRKEDWKREEEDRVRTKKEAEKRRHIERVQRRIDKSD